MLQPLMCRSLTNEPVKKLRINESTSGRCRGVQFSDWIIG